ncbi:MAG: hypothetical protein HYV29_05845 [Ignavibacteriales bacterium]|nr:hypothetical protein [Ignavibacteriales bacterium]
MKAKLFLLLLSLSAAVWLTLIVLKNIEVSNLIEFGTVQFRPDLTVEQERTAYALFAEYSIVAVIAYTFVIVSAAGYLATSHQSARNEGWLLMSAILLFIFVPVELYCFWLDWKLIGLQHWGEWPVEEFRKVFLNRITALAGLPFIAQLCYFTIPLIVIFKPLRRTDISSE